MSFFRDESGTVVEPDELAVGSFEHSSELDSDLCELAVYMLPSVPDAFHRKFGVGRLVGVCSTGCTLIKNLQSGDRLYGSHRNLWATVRGNIGWSVAQNFTNIVASVLDALYNLWSCCRRLVYLLQLDTEP
ncbi:unnamed protein product [Gongylonema pulchrum]|uniref:CPSF_A domain-containing protein n=1 Tax=Gongylonema pulchrum TaxID=637853 RepID=A0A183ECY5_9BILA|nr:unnamed protein product [Gongylonema pulchrum]